MRKSFAILLLLALCSAPLQAQECCFEQPSKYACFWSKNAGLIGGALCGAGAGAIAGIAFARQGEKGCCGEAGKRGARGLQGLRGKIGPPGTSFLLPKDPTHTLTINYDLYLVIDEEIPSGQIVVTPFVTFPNQRTKEGTPETFHVGSGPNPLDIVKPITISKPSLFYGNYEIGVRVANATGSTIDFAFVELSLLATVTASRDGSVTSLTNTAPAAINFIGSPGKSSETQTSLNFTYDKLPPGTIP